MIPGALQCDVVHLYNDKQVEWRPPMKPQNNLLSLKIYYFIVLQQIKGFHTSWAAPGEVNEIDYRIKGPG